MPSQPPSRLREAVRGAVDRGLGFLEASIRPDGAWPSRMYWNLELTGPAEEELAPFVAALGALTLAVCGDPRSRSLQNRSGEFIVRSMRHPGVWRYWPNLPNDLDSLSLCSQAVPWHPWVLFGMNLGCLPTAQDGRGRFRTWLAPSNKADGVDVDSVVNANVVGYLASQGRNALGEQAAACWPAWSGKGTRRGAPTTTPTPWTCTMPWPAPASGACPRSRTSGLCSWTGSRPVAVRTAGTATRCAPRAPSPPCTSSALRRRAKRCGPRSSGSCAGNGRTEAGRSTASGRGPLPPDPPSVGFASAMLDTASCVEALVRSIPFPKDPEPDVRREPSEADAPETGHAQASREPALRSSSGTGADRMQERKIVRGGTPIVCLASQSAFQQEAGVHLALSADHSGSPVPRISIEIVPDPAAEEPRPAKPAGKQGKKHD